MKNGDDIIRLRIKHNIHKDKSEQYYKYELWRRSSYLFVKSDPFYFGNNCTSEIIEYKWYELIKKMIDLKKYRINQYIKENGNPPKKTNVLSDKSNFILLTYAGAIIFAGFSSGLWFYDFTRTDDLKNTKQELISKMDTLLSRANVFANQEKSKGDSNNK